MSCSQVCVASGTLHGMASRTQLAGICTTKPTDEKSLTRFREKFRCVNKSAALRKAQANALQIVPKCSRNVGKKISAQRRGNENANSKRPGERGNRCRQSVPIYEICDVGVCQAGGALIAHGQGQHPAVLMKYKSHQTVVVCSSSHPPTSPGIAGKMGAGRSQS